MIIFVKYTPCGQIFHIYFYLLTFNILRPCDDTHFPLDDLIKPRERQTAFVADLFAFDVDYFRVYQYMPLAFVILVLRRVHHKQPPPNPNLRSCQPDPSSILHRYEHIRDQTLQFRIKDIHRLSNRQ